MIPPNAERWQLQSKSKIVPVQEFAAGFELTQDAIFDAAVAAADTVSLTLHGLRVSPWPGKATKTKVVAALGGLGPVNVRALLVTKTWLAASQPGLLVAILQLDPRLRALLTTNKVLSRPSGKWQDIALFQGEKVLVWSCTHEGDAVLHGSRDWLLSLGLVPRRAEAIPVRTETIDDESFDEIRRLARDSTTA